MPEITTDKKAESIKALKDANKHLAEIFNDLNKKDLTLKTCADDINRLAAQVGSLRAEVWVSNGREVVLIKTYLEAIANSLNGARS